MAVQKVTVYGAGIAGLVASVNLAKAGYRVQVREKRETLGGATSWHPSVHHQVFDLEKTSNFINVDITPCFKPVKVHTFYFYEKKTVFDHPRHSYVCEKGPNLTSIEAYLYDKAKGYNVEFIFGESFKSRDLKVLRMERCPCILATGLEEEPYQILGIRSRRIQGFRASGKIEDGNRVISYLGGYTQHEFAYVASYGNLVFSLLFSRGKINGRNLDVFQKNLMESEGLFLDNWEFSKGCVPVQKNLYREGVVLAGTISGMIDPFYLNGISGALISGKIASLWFIDQKKATDQFNSLTRNFALKKCLKYIANFMPIKNYSAPAMCMLNNRFRGVGVI